MQLIHKINPLLSPSCTVFLSAKDTCERVLAADTATSLRHKATILHQPVA